MDFNNSGEIAWKDLTVFVAGSRCTKIRGLRFRASQELEHLFAEGDEPVSIQSGNRIYEGELKVLVGALDKIESAIQLLGGRDGLDGEFDVVGSYQPAIGRPLKTVTIVGIKLEGIEEALNQNDKFMEVSLTFKCLAIKKVSV